MNCLEKPGKLFTHAQFSDFKFSSHMLEFPSNSKLTGNRFGCWSGVSILFPLNLGNNFTEFSIFKYFLSIVKS